MVSLVRTGAMHSVRAGDVGMQRVRLYEPDLSGNEMPYVVDCLTSTWISSNGEYIRKFEQSFADYVGSDHAVAVCNGTVALHLALSALELGPGDEVIVPTFTYIASVNTIAQTGATPVFVDCNEDTWVIDGADVERLITPRTRAIMAVHLYGGLCDLAQLRALAERRGLHLVEDASEALGCSWNGRHAGTWGACGTFSFYGNKTITTGEGGMVVTNDAYLAERLRLLRGQGQHPTRRYWHVELGFNYRMTNICAAIGLAQMERLDQILERKRSIAARYRQRLQNQGVLFQARHPEVKSGEWLATVLLPDEIDRDAVMDRLDAEGVECRPTFCCAHHMPMYEAPFALPRSEAISRRGISLPSHPLLSDEDIDQVCDSLVSAIERCTPTSAMRVRFA
jgi:perosamine synthetase